ncbi:MAG: PQQ-binding-like beta-propeller repeat protein [Rhodocyclales bacterium]|nr:PQQ-binding-like beta-propeller repeat protein [Rhodocyclales bacterium]
MNPKTEIVRRLNRAALAGVLGLAVAGAVEAAPTDIATAPLITPGTSTVKPNMFFILDNSGSMNWDYLPDWVVDSTFCKGTAATGTSYYCCRTPSGANITSATDTSTCLPQNSSGSNLDGNGNTNLRGMPPFMSSDFNSIYYNPAITYTTPQSFDAQSLTVYSGGSVPWDGYGVQYGTGNAVTLTTSFPDVEWCTDGTYTDCLRNDNYLLPGTVNAKNYTTMRAVTATGSLKPFATGTVDAPTTVTRNVGPYYYVMIPGEYCTSRKLSDCSPQSGPTAANPFPATLRWCDSTTLANCQAVKNSTYRYPRYPTVVISTSGSGTATATITISSVGDSNCTTSGTSRCGAGAVGTVCVGRTNVVTVNSIVVAGSVQILSSPFVYCSSSNTSSTRRSGLASSIASRIGNGFSGIASGSVVTVGGAPGDATYNGASLSVAAPGAGLTTTSFNTGGGPVTVNAVPGRFQRIDIVSGQTYGNITVDGQVVLDRELRTDCISRPTCTYEEELANFAKWFAWYRSRMQMMKSSVSLGFQGVDERFRVGYFTINSASSNLTNADTFDPTHRAAWYAKLFAANPSGGTPLRVALSQAGRIYAGEEAISGAIDPVEYSCQKNFAILSTDGYWNGNNGTTVGGITGIGNHDGSLPRPELDGRNDSSTLADGAAYFYNTDLRDSTLSNCTGALGSSVCANDVPTSSADPRSAQHMSTYTIGLGVDGVMKFRSNYKDPALAGDLPDDYEAISNGTAANPGAGVCPWQTTGACNWPQPGADKQENIDDLWHAAVNGHGTYYSARNPLELNAGLRDLLASLSTQTGGASAATTSNPNVTAGDNQVFSSTYVTSDWVGDLESKNLDITTGEVLPGVNWSARTQLDITPWATRNLYTFDASAGNGRKDFDWPTLNNAVATQCNPPLSERGCFSSPFIDASLAQYCTTGAICLSTTQKTDAAGQLLVEFLQGSRDHEETAALATDRWYRKRANVLGDIVSAEAVYAGRYLFDYGTANGYPARNSPRANPTVYVAANDGMLHAFDSATGNERWAYVPSMVLRNMHKLADFEYPAKHTFLVDGTPVMADINTGTGWKTILVGGLGAGGSGYYAIDISNQTDPTVLWELRAGQVQADGTVQSCTLGTSPRYNTVGKVTAACDLGYSFGNPVIGKVGGTPVVFVTSGYNNTAGGDGEGHLYMLNAETGAVITEVSTGAGDTTTPSGLGRIAGWADNPMQDSTITHVYGGDLLGNMWAFNLTSGSPVVELLINVGASKGITAKPALGLVTTNSGARKRVVLFPTGRLLGNADLNDVSAQSFYGIWDADGSAPTTIVPSVIAAGGEGRTGSVMPSVFEDNDNLGWRIDFPDAGERGNTDPKLAFGTVVFTTNRPTSPDPCNPSGFESWIYNVDYRSGGVVQVEGDANTFIAKNYHGASTRPSLVLLPGGQVISITVVSGGPTGKTEVTDEIRRGGVYQDAKRVSWRELMD